MPKDGMGSSYGQMRAAAGNRQSNLKVDMNGNPIKKKVITSKAGGLDKYAKNNKMQNDLKPYQKYGMPYEFGPGAPGTKPLKKEATASKPKSPAKPKAPSIAQRRAEMDAKKLTSPAVGRTKVIPTRGGDMYRMSEELGISGNVKAKAPSVKAPRKYTDKEKQINALLATGKKKDGTMKASAQRKIQKIRRSK